MDRPLDRSLPYFRDKINSVLKENENDMSVTDIIRNLRSKAYMKIMDYLCDLENNRFCDLAIINDIADQKCFYISQATTKKHMAEITAVSKSEYNGCKYISLSPFHIASEELAHLCDYYSDHVPGSEECKHLFELFLVVFPERREEILL